MFSKTIGSLIVFAALTAACAPEPETEIDTPATSDTQQPRLARYDADEASLDVEVDPRIDVITFRLTQGERVLKVLKVDGGAGDADALDSFRESLSPKLQQVILTSGMGDVDAIVRGLLIDTVQF